MLHKLEERLESEQIYLRNNFRSNYNMAILFIKCTGNPSVL